MPQENNYPWLKSKGYLHVTPKLDVIGKEKMLIQKITDPSYVASYAFFPLIHSVIKERRFKKINKHENKRAHSITTGSKIKKQEKKRPLHYACQMDALLFGYYSSLISTAYEKELEKTPGLSDCITAYRKVRIPGSDKNKGTVHFAYDVFSQIRASAKEGCMVLKFDIESFFNRMNHGKLKEKWMSLFEENGKLPADHYNVFKAATQFSYILKDNFRLDPIQRWGKRRTGFDEKKLAWIRNNTGKHCFFESTREFRAAVKSGRLKIHKYPFRNESGEAVGIPQGLPISSVLANLYLLDFDLTLFSKVAPNGFYRRYSDDIIVICPIERGKDILQFVHSEIKRSEVNISDDKTEHFIYKQVENGDGTVSISCSKMIDEVTEKKGVPLTYLGFEFYGERIAVKSANIAKFYRRMIRTVRRKVKRAFSTASVNPELKPILFRRQLYRLYTLQSLSATKLMTRYKWIEKRKHGGYILKSELRKKKHRSNYLKYIDRAAHIMNDKGIEQQLRKHERILMQAIHKNFRKERERMN